MKEPARTNFWNGKCCTCGIYTQEENIQICFDSCHRCPCCCCCCCASPCPFTTGGNTCCRFYRDQLCSWLLLTLLFFAGLLLFSPLVPFENVGLAPNIVLPSNGLAFIYSKPSITEMQQRAETDKLVGPLIQFGKKKAAEMEAAKANAQPTPAPVPTPPLDPAQIIKNANDKFEQILLKPITEANNVLQQAIQIKDKLKLQQQNIATTAKDVASSLANQDDDDDDVSKIAASSPLKQLQLAPSESSAQAGQKLRDQVALPVNLLSDLSNSDEQKIQIAGAQSQRDADQDEAGAADGECSDDNGAVNAAIGAFGVHTCKQALAFGACTAAHFSATMTVSCCQTCRSANRQLRDKMVHALGQDHGGKIDPEVAASLLNIEGIVAQRRFRTYSQQRSHFQAYQHHYSQMQQNGDQIPEKEQEAAKFYTSPAAHNVFLLQTDGGLNTAAQHASGLKALSNIASIATDTDFLTALNGGVDAAVKSNHPELAPQSRSSLFANLFGGPTPPPTPRGTFDPAFISKTLSSPMAQKALNTLAGGPQAQEALNTLAGLKAQGNKAISAFDLISTRPVCFDDDGLIAQATENKLSKCADAQQLCNSKLFSIPLGLACPQTCGKLKNAAHRVCKGCQDDDEMVNAATGGKAPTCKSGKTLCQDREFGIKMQAACPKTCDMCGFFSTSTDRSNLPSLSKIAQLLNLPMIVPKIPDLQSALGHFGGAGFENQALKFMGLINDGTFIHVLTQSIFSIIMNGGPRSEHTGHGGRGSDQAHYGGEQTFNFWGTLNVQVAYYVQGLKLFLNQAYLPVVWHRGSASKAGATTLLDIEFPDLTLNPLTRNLVEVGFSGIIARHWLNDNSDVANRIVNPMIRPFVKKAAAWLAGESLKKHSQAMNALHRTFSLLNLAAGNITLAQHMIEKDAAIARMALSGLESSTTQEALKQLLFNQAFQTVRSGFGRGIDVTMPKSFGSLPGAQEAIAAHPGDTLAQLKAIAEGIIKNPKEAALSIAEDVVSDNLDKFGKSQKEIDQLANMAQKIRNAASDALQVKDPTAAALLFAHEMAEAKKNNFQDDDDLDDDKAIDKKNAPMSNGQIFAELSSGGPKQKQAMMELLANGIEGRAQRNGDGGKSSFDHKDAMATVQEASSLATMMGFLNGGETAEGNNEKDEKDEQTSIEDMLEAGTAFSQSGTDFSKLFGNLNFGGTAEDKRLLHAARRLHQAELTDFISHRFAKDRQAAKSHKAFSDRRRLLASRGVASAGGDGSASLSAALKGMSTTEIMHLLHGMPALTMAEFYDEEADANHPEHPMYSAMRQHRKLHGDSNIYRDSPHKSKAANTARQLTQSPKDTVRALTNQFIAGMAGSSGDGISNSWSAGTGTSPAVSKSMSFEGTDVEALGIPAAIAAAAATQAALEDAQIHENAARLESSRRRMLEQTSQMSEGEQREARKQMHAEMMANSGAKVVEGQEQIIDDGTGAAKLKNAQVQTMESLGASAVDAMIAEQTKSLTKQQKSLIDGMKTLTPDDIKKMGQLTPAALEVTAALEVAAAAAKSLKSAEQNAKTNAKTLANAGGGIASQLKNGLKSLIKAAGPEPVIAAAQAAERTAFHAVNSVSDLVESTYDETVNNVKHFFDWKNLNPPDCAITVGGSLSVQVNYGNYITANVEVGATCSVPIIAGDLSKLVMEIDPADQAKFVQMEWWEQLIYIFNAKRLAPRASYILDVADCGKLGLGNLKRIGGLDRNVWLICVPWWCSVFLVVVIWGKRHIGGFRPPPLDRTGNAVHSLVDAVMNVASKGKSMAEHVKQQAESIERKTNLAIENGTAKKQAGHLIMNAVPTAAEQAAKDKIADGLGWARAEVPKVAGAARTAVGKKEAQLKALAIQKGITHFRNLGPREKVQLIKKAKNAKKKVGQVKETIGKVKDFISPDSKESGAGWGAGAGWDDNNENDGGFGGNSLI